jgi:hypothetical protein
MRVSSYNTVRYKVDAVEQRYMVNSGARGIILYETRTTTNPRTEVGCVEYLTYNTILKYLVPVNYTNTNGTPGDFAASVLHTFGLVATVASAPSGRCGLRTRAGSIV